MSSYIIVAGIDYTDLGKAALDEAIALSALHDNSEIHVLHVDSKLLPPKEEAQEGTGSLAHSAAALDHLEELCRRRLEAYADRRGAPAPLKRMSTHFRYGTPAKEIVQAAADFHADLVVVGTHGRTGLKRLVLGSVAEKVLRTAPCQVLVVREKQKREEAQLLDEIEPLCDACHQARIESGGEVMWCKRHAEPRHVNTHRYTYGYRNYGEGAQSTRLGTNS